jgi:hypothetical protein
MLRTMAISAEGDNIITGIAIVVVVLFGSLAAICASQFRRVGKLACFYAVSNALMSTMHDLVLSGLSLLVVIGTLRIAKLTSASVSIEAFFAFSAVGVFAFVYVGGVGVIKRVGTFFAPVGKPIAFAAILVKKIDRFRVFAPGAILFLHKKASYQSWSVRLLRAYNHRQEAGKTIAALRLTVKNVCPEWS